MTMSRFSAGESVRVREDDPPIHHRTPWYVKGKTGTVDAIYDAWPNPEEMAYGRTDGSPVRLYRIAFGQADLWDSYTGSPQDTLIIDIFEHWLEPVKETDR